MKPFFSLVLAALILGWGVPVGADEPSRPNILWLTSEDNSARWLGCYGNPHAQTPNLDGLAREGFRYTHAYANAPVCAPQRSTWITGVLALSMGTHNMRSLYPIPHDVIGYYPDSLRANGYYTGNWRKRDYNIGGRDGKEAWDSSEAVDWGALKQRQPFFQVLNFGASHESAAFGDLEDTKHDPADTTLARYHPDVPDMRKNYARYHDAISRMDGQIGEALAKLEAQGLAENTIVVYVSDHGGVLPRSKRFLFRSGLHCPLILRIPQAYRALWPADSPGSTVERMVGFVDMPKTWLSITGSAVPEPMQGRVFLGPDTEPERDVHLAFRGRMDERIDNARAVTDKRFLYIRNYMPYVPWMQKLTFLWNMKASGAWVQAVADGKADEIQSRLFFPKGQVEELYDMQSDPDCVENLAECPDHQPVLERLRTRLRERQLEVFDAGLMPETEMVRMASDHDTTMYEMVRDPALYDVAGLLDAADLALAQDPAHRAALRGLLDHEHVGMRYWGVVGGFLLNDDEIGRAAIDDPSHEVRAMAAWLLIRAGEKDAGLAVLRQLIEQRSYALQLVLNVVVWMGDDAEPLVPMIGALVFEESYPNQYKYEIRIRDIVVEKFSGAAPLVP